MCSTTGRLLSVGQVWMNCWLWTSTDPTDSIDTCMQCKRQALQQWPCEQVLQTADHILQYCTKHNS